MLKLEQAQILKHLSINQILRYLLKETYSILNQG